MASRPVRRKGNCSLFDGPSAPGMEEGPPTFGERVSESRTGDNKECTQGRTGSPSPSTVNAARSNGCSSAECSLVSKAAPRVASGFSATRSPKRARCATTTKVSAGSSFFPFQPFTPKPPRQRSHPPAHKPPPAANSHHARAAINESTGEGISTKV